MPEKSPLDVMTEHRPSLLARYTSSEQRATLDRMLDALSSGRAGRNQQKLAYAVIITLAREIAARDADRDRARCRCATQENPDAAERPALPGDGLTVAADDGVDR